MATQAQIDANRRNAQKSTGPTSQAGKAKCASNRYSHGLCAHMTFLRWENSEEFTTLRADLHAEYQPVTRTEMLLVDRMVIGQWTMERAVTLQTMIVDKSERIQHVMPDLGLTLRYLQTAEKSFYKARTELLSIQKERKESEIGSESQDSLAVPEEPPQEVEATPEAPVEAVSEPPAAQNPIPEEKKLKYEMDIDAELAAFDNPENSRKFRNWINRVRTAGKAA